MSQEQFRVEQQAVLRDMAVANYVRGERLIVELANSFFRTGKIERSPMTVEIFNRFVELIDEGKELTLDTFSMMFGSRQEVREGPEFRARLESSNMWRDCQNDESSPAEFKMFAHARLTIHLERRAALIESMSTLIDK